MNNATNQELQGGQLAANLYAGSGATVDSDMVGAHIFLWLTLTMMWVLMILCILALFKYVTQEPHMNASAPRSRSKKSSS